MSVTFDDLLARGSPGHMVSACRRRLVARLPMLLILLALFTLGVATAQAQTLGRHSVRVGGVERSFVLRLPPILPQGQTMPVVLVLHGGGGNADHAERMTGMTELAMREGFIVVYPEGSGQVPGKLLTWNAGHCCGYAMQHGVDDVAFIRALLDKLQAEHPVDPRRIYITGMSNGGMLTHRLGIALPQRIAAIAPVVAALFGDEVLPHHSVPALMINGARDRSVPLAGGPPGGRFAAAWDGTPTLAASAQGAFWARANRCDPTPQHTREGALSRTEFRCPVGTQVTLLTLADEGHAWPGGQAGTAQADQPGHTLNASETIWHFFRAHHRGAP